jgi:tetratricopeptide (TPR) repeat protein
MRRLSLLALLLALAAPASAARAGAAPETANTVLIFPFENTSKVAASQDYNWIGESFSEMLSELLDASGDLQTLRPDERTLAYEREGLPPTAVLTRATSIKVGERAGADLIIIGTYRVDGEKTKETITVTARMIDLREGRVIGNELNRGAKLSDLQELQGEMAYEIMRQRDPALSFSKGDVVGQATKIPPSAYADFMKAITTSDRQNKAAFLARAIDAYAKGVQNGQFTQAIFELGRISYLDSKWNDAIKLLSRVDAKYPRYIEAAFYLGVAHANAKQNDAAVKVFTDLVPKMPLYEVYNNAGVVYLRAGRIDDAILYLKPAAEAATRDLDTQFNYGYALWLKNDFAGAAAQLQKAVRRRPADGEAVRYSQQDGEAFYLIAKASERIGKSAEAAEALDQAKRYLPSFAQWETRRQIPDLTRLKGRFSRVALGDFRRSADVVRTSAPGVGGSAEDAMAAARTLFDEGRDREALDQLGRVLQLTPDNAEAHLLRGRIFERSAEYERAIEALKAATFWNPKSLVAYVTLGRIYVFRNDCANADAAMRKALQLDPASADALALKRSVDAKCGRK